MGDIGAHSHTSSDKHWAHSEHLLKICGKALKIVGKASRSNELEMGQGKVLGGTPDMKSLGECRSQGSQPHPTIRHELQSLTAIKLIFSQLLILGVMSVFGISLMHFCRILECFGLEEP